MDTQRPADVAIDEPRVSVERDGAGQTPFVSGLRKYAQAMSFNDSVPCLSSVSKERANFCAVIWLPLIGANDVIIYFEDSLGGG